ncbi:MAG: glycosyltransferase family 39 protein, partial [Thiogranum sp.]
MAKSMQEHSIGKREVIAVALIILTALLVRWPGLFESLWFDEIWYTKTMFAFPGQLDQVLWKDVHPPAYTLTLLAWTDLFGDSELSVRMPSLLCGLASLALLWFIARRWLGSLQALLVTALMALSPPHIWYSHENKVNMMLLLFTLYSVWLYWQASQTRETRDWIIATIVMTATLYTHAYAVPVAAAIYIWLTWRAFGDRTLLKPVVLSGLFIALAFAPMVLLKYSQRDELVRGYLRQLSPAELYKLLLVWLPSGNTLRTIGPYSPFSKLLSQPWSFFLLEAVFAFLLGRGLWVVFLRARGDGWLKPSTQPAVSEPARLILLWFAMPLIFTAAGSLITRHFYIERNLLVILPPFLLLLAAGVSIGLPRWAKTAAISGVLALFLAATVSLRFIKSEVWTVYKYKPDWRSAMLYFSEEARSNETTRVLVTVPSEPLSYYQRRIHLENSAAGSMKRPVVQLICNVEPAIVLEEIQRREWPTFYMV